MTELEEEKTRSSALEKLSLALSVEHKIKSIAAAITDTQSQLREKNDKIQQLESRQKTDKKRLEDFTKTIEHLEAEVEDKNAEIRILKKVRTHSDVHKMESMAAGVKDLQSQLQERNARIQSLESRKQKVEEKLREMTAIVLCLSKKLKEVKESQQFSQLIKNGDN